MVIDHSYKISSFGSFSDIVPNTETMLFFLQTFNKYGWLPSIFQEQSNRLSHRIALLSENEEEQVMILSNRIDFEIKAQDDIKLSPEKLAIIIPQIEDCFHAIFEKFNKKGTRLALNVTSYIVNLNDNEINHFMEQYSNPISIYNKAPLDEWSTRLMVRKEAPISQTNETFNIITSLIKTNLQKTINGITTESKGFSVDVDINTIAERSDDRFGSDHIKEFIAIANNWWNTIIAEMG